MIIALKKKGKRHKKCLLTCFTIICSYFHTIFLTVFRNFTLLLSFCLLSILAVEANPNRRGGSYNQYSAGAAGGGYVQTSGGSYRGHNNRGPYYNPKPRSSAHSSGNFEAKRGFATGGGSVSAGYDKGYNNGNSY